jgi:hypothetical protein
MFEELVSPIIKLVTKAVPDADKKAEIEKHVLILKTELEKKFLTERTNVLKLESNQSNNFITKNYRAITVLSCVVLIMYYYLISPILHDIGFPIQIRDLPSQVMVAMDIVLGTGFGLPALGRIGSVFRKR